MVAAAHIGHPRRSQVDKVIRRLLSRRDVVDPHAREAGKYRPRHHDGNPTDGPDPLRREVSRGGDEHDQVRIGVGVGEQAHAVGGGEALQSASGSRSASRHARRREKAPTDNLYDPAAHNIATRTPTRKGADGKFPASASSLIRCQSIGFDTGAS